MIFGVSLGLHLNTENDIKNDYGERMNIMDALSINADEWVEKCTQYEYYEEHEVGYLIKITDELTCNVGYRACFINDNININCEQQHDECIEQYSTPHIKTINKSRCVETMLVKVI